MKYADCAEDTVHDQGGSNILMAMLLNQINGRKLLQLSSRQCSGHPVQLQSHKAWKEGSVPTSWHEATVAAIFKKDDPACCENYRPISLLAVGYKIFAAILLRRLKDAGAEGRIWPTQFGFRSGCGCADALFIARRKVENAWARKDGNLLLLALDWAKTFDSISPAGLVNAMSRFGIPYHFGGA